jgi:hypothetical protein
MQLSIKIVGKISDASGTEKEISFSTGMIGPAPDDIAEAAMIEFVRQAQKQSGKPIAITGITATMLSPDELKPDDYKEILAKIFLNS